MSKNKKYLVEFKSNDTLLQEEGFNVCLAITTLDLPLDIIIHGNKMMKQCQSLSDFDMAKLYMKSELSEAAYQALKQQAAFFLEF